MSIELTHIVFTDFKRKYRRVFIKSIQTTTQQIEAIRSRYLAKYGLYDESVKIQLKQIHFNYVEKN
jgi:hypothetical protein